MQRDSPRRDSSGAPDIEPADEEQWEHRSGVPKQTGEKQQTIPNNSATLQGPRLWVLILGLYLGLYLIALELTMLSTVIPTLTNEFNTLSDISWYETSYVLALCAFTPLVAKMYNHISVKIVYISFMVVSALGLLICALATSSSMFVVGRAISGLGSAGQFSGMLLIIGVTVPTAIRQLVSAIGISMISIGSMTGPVIAGVLTAHVGWRWCFWMLLPISGFVIAVTFLTPMPSVASDKQPVCQALRALFPQLDPIGFIIFAAASTMLLLAVNWGGSVFPWSSATIIGLLCGGLAISILFIIWSLFRKEKALIPPSCFTHRSVLVGSVVFFLQAGVSQSIPFFLPLWFQAVKGDSPRDSAIHLLPSLVTQVVALVLYGSLIRKTKYNPPWAIFGGFISSAGAGLLTSLTPASSLGHWVGYQVLTSFGRGIAFQTPVTGVQEFIPQAETATCLSVMSLFMQLGLAVGVSASQTIFSNQLPKYLHQYAPGLNATEVIEAGATGARKLVSPDQMPGFLLAYNKSITGLFFISVASCGIAGTASILLDWQRIEPAAEAE